VPPFPRVQSSNASKQDSANVPITPDLGLVIGVSATTITYPASAEELPTLGDPQVFPEITQGKAGGLESEAQL
jgi:hypothetical protein